MLRTLVSCFLAVAAVLGLQSEARAEPDATGVLIHSLGKPDETNLRLYLNRLSDGTVSVQVATILGTTITASGITYVSESLLEGRSLRKAESLMVAQLPSAWQTQYASYMTNFNNTLNESTLTTGVDDVGLDAAPAIEYSGNSDPWMNLRVEVIDSTGHAMSAAELNSALSCACPPDAFDNLEITVKVEGGISLDVLKGTLEVKFTGKHLRYLAQKYLDTSIWWLRKLRDLNIIPKSLDPVIDWFEKQKNRLPLPAQPAKP